MVSKDQAGWEVQRVLASPRVAVDQFAVVNPIASDVGPPARVERT